MILETALITISCVLFVNMGLSDAIQKVLHFRISILTCPKCLAFWSCISWNFVHYTNYPVIIAISFFFSYLSLWLSLLYDYLSLLYNNCYEQITKTSDSFKSIADEISSDNTDEVS